jgi:hypothetical protein
MARRDSVQRRCGQDGRQQSLLTELEGGAAERRARVRLALAGRRDAADLEAILMYLDHADADGTGCRSFLDTIAARLSGDLVRPVVLARRTLQRRLATLRALGLVRTWWHRGRTRNRVDWESVKRAATRTPEELTTDRTDDTDRDLNSTTSPSSSSSSVVSVPSVVVCSSSKSGAGSRQSGAGSRQSGAANMNSSCESELLDPPPPTPADWDQVVVELRACGVGLATDAKRKALRAGFSPAECLSIIAHWRANRPAWEPGALYRRLAYVDPGIPPGDGWPAADPLAARQRGAALRDRRQAAARAANAAEVAAAAADDAELEARCGPALDNLAATAEGMIELRRVARRVLGSGSAWRAFCQRGARDPCVRAVLLAEIERETTTDRTDDTDKGVSSERSPSSSVVS